MSALPIVPSTPGGDRALLATIHARATVGLPRLERVVPEAAEDGDLVMLLGHGLSGPGVVARFGSVATWVIGLGDGAALAVVPAGTSPGLVTVHRAGLRSNSLPFGDAAARGLPRVLRLEPGEGTRLVLRDAPVVLRLSHPADVATAGGCVRVRSVAGAAPGRVVLGPDARILAWVPSAPLPGGTVHDIELHGLHDLQGRPFAPFVSTYTTGFRTWRELLAP